MGIYYNQEERVFRLDTPGSTYLISIVDEEGFLCHTYYGRRIPDDNMGYLLRLPAGGTDFRNNGRQADLMGPATAWETSGRAASRRRRRRATGPAA